MVYISDVKDLRDFIKISKKKITKSTLKIMYFEFAFLIMKNPFFTITLEMLSGLMRILQLISIPLCDYFSKSWSDGPVFQIITTFINYFNLVPLLKGSDLMFIIFFYISNIAQLKYSTPKIHSFFKMFQHFHCRNFALTIILYILTF